MIDLGRLAPHLERLGPAPVTVVRAGATADADRLVDSGADLVLVEAGGPDAPALAVLAALLDLDPVSAAGTDGAVGWAALVAEVRDGLRAARPHRGDPDALVDAVGASEVQGLARLLTGLARRDTPALLSGVTGVLAAALVAERVTPGTSARLLAADTCARPAGRQALAALRLEPLLDLRLPGPGAAGLALGVLQGGRELGA